MTTYNSWSGLKNRCNNPNWHAYHRYGGRGISYDVRWEKYKNFLADMGEKPTSKHTLDRINNDDHYYKENCRWVLMSEQGKNKGKYKNNKSGETGVYWDKEANLWRVEGKSKGIQTTLGRYEDYEQAVLVARCARGKIL